MEPVTEDVAIASSADKKMESVTKSDRWNIHFSSICIVVSLKRKCDDTITAVVLFGAILYCVGFSVD